jgi:soluble lytic murein transglycosylase
MRGHGALTLALGLVLLGAGPAAAGAATDDRALHLARFREAHRALAAGEYARALASFESLPPEFLLADYAALFAAESLLRGGDEVQGLERLRAFPDRFAASLLVPQALAAAADTAFRLGRFGEAEREARRFLARAPNHPEAARILVRLAEARAAQGLVAEAIGDLRRRFIESPSTAWGEAARELAEDLAAAHGAPLPPLTVEDRFLLAQRLADQGELTAAVRALEELLALDLEPGLRHRAVGRLAPLLGRRDRAADGVNLLRAALQDPATPWRPTLVYELARLHRRLGQLGAAIAALERLISEHPDAGMIPDAWLALARAQVEAGHLAAARATFHTLIGSYPDTPARASAGWELAWLDYRAARWRDAALAFRQLSAAAAGYRLSGLYWAARALDAGAERTAALALYREVLSRGSQTYYGILAQRRVAGALPPSDTPLVRLPTDPRAVLAAEAPFLRGQALWQAGLTGYALAELEGLGRDAAAEPGRAYALAVALADLGEAGRSLRHLRRAFGPAAEAGAPGLTRDFWRLLYPFGYPDLVKDAARRAGLDPFFVAAVIREESSYDVRARSWVGAIGLMQLMPETARLVAQDIGLRGASPDALWEPATNIALGAHYLAQLQARFQEPLFAVAGYNAGPHRVQRWRDDRRTADLEEFVDQIPFDETRAFVKRVFASWHHYRRLYADGERPRRRGEVEAAPRGIR